jgi:hypothetical protein
MIREATEGRLVGKKGSRFVSDTAASGWDSAYIEAMSESWDDDFGMDYIHDGKFLGGEKHWKQFAVL